MTILNSVKSVTIIVRIGNQIKSSFTSKCDLGDLLPLALGQLELLEPEGERHCTWHGGGRQATDSM